MDRGVFKAILLALVLVSLIVLTISIFQPFLVAILWAAVIVTATHPIYRALVRKVGGRETLAALCMTILVALMLITPFVFFAGKVVVEAAEFIDEGLPQIEKTIRKQLEDESTFLARSKAWVESRSGGRLADVSFEGPGKFVVGVATDTLQGIATTIASLFFLLLTLFYLYRDGPVAVHVARELIPLNPDDRELVLGELRDAINAAVRGGLLTALAQGILGGIILWILDIRGAIFWAAVMAFASLIPVVGTALVWGPLALFLAWDGDTGQAAILVAYGIFVIAMADNLLRPILVGQHMKAHPLLLFFGIIGSVMLFGFKGIVLGPVVVAGLTATTTLFRREFARTQSG
jgi:predicted PurR-regulated permease PerM